MSRNDPEFPTLDLTRYFISLREIIMFFRISEVGQTTTYPNESDRKSTFPRMQCDTEEVWNDRERTDPFQW